MRLLGVLWLVGCNQIYGLDETLPVDTDSDDDGLLDVIDNCPAFANPLQENADDDELGDACDPCVGGSNENEDNDLVLDGCDNCPHVANDDQANVDRDDLGDACDHDNMIAHTRVRFDGFAALTLDWIVGVAEWEAIDGSVHAIVAPKPDDFGMWNRRIEVVGQSWLVEIGMTPDATPGALSGLYLRERIGTPEYPCYLTRDTGWILHTLGVTRTLSALPSGPIRIRLRKAQYTMTCEIVGVETITFTQNDSRTGAGLYTTSTTTMFDYVEAVSGG
jgi:hypothetical protein